MGFLANNSWFITFGVAISMGLIIISKEITINDLESDLKASNLKVNELSLNVSILKMNLSSCDEKLTLQNEAIKKQSIRVDDNALNNSIKRVEKVYVKDKSCEAQLRAYKELFNEK